MAKKEGPQTIAVHIDVLEQLLRTADAADALCHLVVDKDFMVDQVKLTNRALKFFECTDIPEVLAKIGSRHPHVVNMWQMAEEQRQAASYRCPTCGHERHDGKRCTAEDTNWTCFCRYPQ